MNEARGPRAAQGAFHVLVVDDDPDMVAYLTRLLRTEGMDAEAALDGEQAFALIADSPPGLVLLDVMMPGVSGFDICRKLKADEATALVPIVLITALEDTESRVRGIEAGADDFLSKPVNREELLARIRTLRRLHEMRKELEERRLAAEVHRKEAIRKAFSRYISPRLTEKVLSESQNGADVFRDLSDRTAVVALFADLRGFTRLSVTVPVSRVVPMMNEFFAELATAVHENEGTIFSMAGDSLLVGFNVPVAQPDAAERALATARVMVRRFAPIARRWKSDFGLTVGIGIGIEAGEVVVGNVGSPSFMSYTIIGDPVNVAARLMQMASTNEILIGPCAMESLHAVLGEANSFDRRELTLRGKAAPVEVLAVRVAAY
ncbi:MAG TPA: response regulator [Burkholderiales bacterium]|nr:response regulator [Burkholderiales bacterium]